MNQEKLKNALNELSAEYNISSNKLLNALQSETEKWVSIKDSPKYQQHRDTGVIRNCSTHRVLRPNNSGFVKVRNFRGEVVAMRQGIDG
ncbi:hypothetical protein ITG08_05925 [Vibrio cyclitrophicus]|uniref:hypothetical protein n=1 Tax=Vibrio cyclitrophicus TaxID=47951 RepID=UPI0020511CAD|nr:hypothetical protein [Vibrio cyclitrophicus]UPR26285.1 hypothetical protein ITG08_05925 [Vibrio cyclitrophicus]